MTRSAAVAPLALAAALLLAAPATLSAQSTLERTPNLPAAWIGLPWMGQLDLLQRIEPDDGRGFDALALPTLTATIGLPSRTLVGASVALQSPVAAGETTEWELFGRYSPLDQATGAPVDAAVQAGLNFATESLDGELAVARVFGPMRLLAAARAFTDGYDAGEARFALVGGAVIRPLPRGAPIAIAGDLGTLSDREAGEEPVWSVGLQVGLSFTPHTLSLHLTNASSGTLEGLSRGDDDVRLGLELTVPVPVGEFAGLYVARERALEAVEPVEPPPPASRAGPAPHVEAAPRARDDIVRVPIRQYAFLPDRLVVEVGTTVVWVNEDDVVHTATAADASWSSGAIPPGERWAARFDEPGIFPYYCGPHPFMQAVVIVR